MRRHEVITERLAQSTLFRACSMRELQQVSRLVTEVPVEAGRVLTTQGEAGHEFMVVLAGTAGVTVNGHDVAVLGPGEFFGEMALIDDGPRTATVTALTPMSLGVVGRREFAALLDEVPAIARQVLAALAGRLRDVDARVSH